MSDDFLRTYLNDHLAGAESGLQLAKDSLSHNPTGPLGGFLAELVQEIEEDRAVLQDVYSRVQDTENPIKKEASRLATKMSRLKLEGPFSSYTDLTRLEELEGLALGVYGKLKLWAALEAACASDDRFGDIDFQTLQRRAQHQHDQLEHHRRHAARKAFAHDHEE